MVADVVREIELVLAVPQASEVRSGRRLHTHEVVGQGPGWSLATPRLDDRSPAAFKVQGPVRVGSERCERARGVCETGAWEGAPLLHLGYISGVSPLRVSPAAAPQ